MPTDREIDRLLPDRDAHDDFYRAIFVEEGFRHEVVDRLYKALAWFGTEQADNFRWAMTRTKHTWYSYERLVSVFAISALFPARLKGVRS